MTAGHNKRERGTVVFKKGEGKQGNGSIQLNFALREGNIIIFLKVNKLRSFLDERENVCCSLVERQSSVTPRKENTKSAKCLFDCDNQNICKQTRIFLAQDAEVLKSL